MNHREALFDNYLFTQQAFITVCDVLESVIPNSTVGDVVKFLTDLDRLGYKITSK